MRRWFRKVLSRRLPEGSRLHLIEFHPETPFGPPKSIRFSGDQIKLRVEAFDFKEEAYVDLGTHYFISFAKVG